MSRRPCSFSFSQTTWNLRRGKSRNWKALPHPQQPDRAIQEADRSPPERSVERNAVVCARQVQHRFPGACIVFFVLRPDAGFMVFDHFAVKLTNFRNGIAWPGGKIIAVPCPRARRERLCREVPPHPEGKFARVRTLGTIGELQQALQEFKDDYNDRWLIQRRRRSPIRFRRYIQARRARLETRTFREWSKTYRRRRVDRNRKGAGLRPVRVCQANNGTR